MSARQWQKKTLDGRAWSEGAALPRSERLPAKLTGPSTTDGDVGEQRNGAGTVADGRLLGRQSGDPDATPVVEAHA